MPGFGVVPGGLQRTSGRLSDVAGEMDTSVRGLERTVDGLLTSGWRGSAASGFRSEWDRWHAAALELTGALHEMADRLGGTARGYAAAEQQIAATVTRALPTPSSATICRNP